MEAWMAEAYRDKERNDWLNRLPVCACCKEPIQTEKCTELLGNMFCEDCVQENTHHVADLFLEDYL